jgi:coenzyme F420-reducing hydrogenase delta subunit
MHVVLLSDTMLVVFAGFTYAECHYSESRHDQSLLSDTMLVVVIVGFGYAECHYSELYYV